jgi:hypothetical protein
VAVDESGQQTTEAAGLKKLAAVKIAKSLCADLSGVYVTWFRESDGQKGYLNSDGNHSVDGREWRQVGGKREGAGRKAPLGRKKTVGVRLTPDAEQFCREQPEGFTILEDMLRKTKQFRQWLAGRQPVPRE